MLTRKDFWEICPQQANNERDFKGAVEVVAGCLEAVPATPFK